MIENKNLIFKVSTRIIKFALKIVYFGSFLVWKLFFRRNIPTKWSVKLTGSTSTIEMRFSEGTSRPLQICPGNRSAEWLTDFETPAGIKTDPILNNYLTQTMENNECSLRLKTHSSRNFPRRRTNGKDLSYLLSPRSTYRLRPVE